MSERSAQGRRLGAQLAMVVGGAAACALAPDPVRVWLVVGVAVLAAAATAAAARRDRSGRLAWSAIAAALVLNAVGDVAFTVLAARGPVPFPSVLDVAYLLYYPLFAAGLWCFARQRGRDRDSLIDAAIVAVGSSVVIWQFLVVPALDEAGTGTVAKLVTAGYPVGDLVLVAFLARLAFGRSDGSRALQLLGAAVTTMFVADLAYLATNLYGGADGGTMSDVAYAVAYGLLAVAARHPSAATRPRPETAERARMGWGRLLLLTITTLAAPTVAMATSDGLQLPMLASAVLFLLVMGRVAGLLRQLARSGERRFESLVENSTELVAIIDGTTVRYASPSLVQLAGSAGGSAGFRLADVVHPADLATAEELLERTAALPPRSSTEGEFRVRDGAGGWKVFAASLTNLRRDPDINGVVLNAHDIDELRRLASFDPLTGLANRDQFQRRLRRALADGHAVNVLLFDLDGFKEVNDSLGHHAGDQVLIATAGRLRRVAGASHLVCRLGGDEFAVLQVGDVAAEATAAAALAIERLLEPVEVDGVAVGVGASIGIARHEPCDAGAAAPAPAAAEELVRCADIALYQAKGEGKARAVVYEASMSEPVLRRLALRNGLETAIANGELCVHYQPLCRLDDGSVRGFEALLRWQHPELGHVSPAEFIPAAEESHLIVSLGRWVLDQAIAQLAAWQRRPGWDRLSMSVNLSPRQLHDPELVTTVDRLLARAGVDPSTLLLEITEQALIERPAAAVAVFRRLKQLGVRLAIDDYGSGNASIAYLRQFPIDEIKIDRSLVAPLDGACDTSHALVRSIVELAAALGLDTVAEGIETEDQATALRELGASNGQGYLLGRPAAADAVAPPSSIGPINGLRARRDPALRSG
ncbi:MAG: EAL domain-containing protein [Acidimicrobiales bacterium]